MIGRLVLGGIDGVGSGIATSLSLFTIGFFICFFELNQGLACLCDFILMCLKIFCGRCRKCFMVRV